MKDYGVDLRFVVCDQEYFLCDNTPIKFCNIVRGYLSKLFRKDRNVINSHLFKFDHKKYSFSEKLPKELRSRESHGHANLDSKFKMWMWDNIKHKCIIDYSPIHGDIYFENSSDLMLYKLKWL